MRFYDPSLARWITTDPAGFVDGTNLYAYALNNPLMYKDPDGRFVIALPFLIWGATGLALPSFMTVATYVAGGVALGLSIVAAEKLIQTANQSFSDDSQYSKNVDVYAPDRPLPREEDGDPIPDTDAPHTQLGTKESRRKPGVKYPQAREFDGSGLPVKDIDFTDHGRPNEHPLPHQHEHEPNKTGGTPKRSEEAKPVPNWSHE